MPAATAAAEQKQDDPAALQRWIPRIAGWGRTARCWCSHPQAIPEMLVLPITIAPAHFQPAHDFRVLGRHEFPEQRRSEGSANGGGRACSSLIAVGRPCSGPSGSPFMTAFSARFASVARLVGGERHDGIELGIERCDHRKMRVEHFNRA